jgi:hypothetical protein
MKSILFHFWRGVGWFQVCFTDWENAGMPENYRFRFIMDYEYKKKKEIH